MKNNKYRSLISTLTSFFLKRGLLIVQITALSIMLPIGSGLMAKGQDTCVDCHSNPKFEVTNKKLFNYFQEWELSIHKNEDVSCADCHGGNKHIASKEGAHGNKVTIAAKESSVNFKRIPETCGKCHKDIYKGFKQSRHFEMLVRKKAEKQAPTCVTCHSSINSQALKVSTIKEACSKCHNIRSKNHQKVPLNAHMLLTRFRSIKRFNNYIKAKGDPNDPKTKSIIEESNKKIKNLSVTWHTFDIDEIEVQTMKLLDFMKQKREQIKRK